MKLWGAFTYVHATLQDQVSTLCAQVTARISMTTHTHTHADAGMTDERIRKQSIVDHTLTHTHTSKAL